jgi:hypothetical protein
MPRMRKTLLAASIIFSSVGTASAGGQPGSVGVGTEVELSGLGGLSVNYDAGKFHVGGFIGFDDPAGGNNTRIDIGGRFFFHVAGTASSDFSVGGGLGIRNQGRGAAAGSTTSLFVEPSFQIRAFIATNVALSFTGGFSVGAADASELVIDGQVEGIAGVHYYFF